MYQYFCNEFYQSLILLYSPPIFLKLFTNIELSGGKNKALWLLWIWALTSSWSLTVGTRTSVFVFFFWIMMIFYVNVPSSVNEKVPSSNDVECLIKVTIYSILSKSHFKLLRIYLAISRIVSVQSQFYCFSG